MCCDLLLTAQAVPGVSAADPSFHLELDAKPLAAREARRFVTEHLADFVEDGALTLLTSELVTNGILHARTHLRLGVMTGDDHVLVTCSDDDTRGTPIVPPQDDSRPSGRGLMLVDALASQWGVHRTDEGKTVWFTLPRGAGASTGGGAA
jgi:anti-sigma regulatory factor (Ser/Thr protein kinase)